MDMLGVGGFIILIVSTPQPTDTQEHRQTATSNELVWPYKASGLSEYICQFHHIDGLLKLLGRWCVSIRARVCVCVWRGSRK